MCACLLADSARLGAGGGLDHLRACVTRKVLVGGIWGAAARGRYAGVTGDQTVQRKGAA